MKRCFPTENGASRPSGPKRRDRVEGSGHEWGPREPTDNQERLPSPLCWPRWSVPGVVLALEGVGRALCWAPGDLTEREADAPGGSAHLHPDAFRVPDAWSPGCWPPAASLDNVAGVQGTSLPN